MNKRELCEIIHDEHDFDLGYPVEDSERRMGWNGTEEIRWLIGCRWNCGATEWSDWDEVEQDDGVNEAFDAGKERNRDNA